MRIRIYIVAFNDAVTQADDPVCIGGNIFFVGYQDHGVAVGMDLAKELHDLY